MFSLDNGMCNCCISNKYSPLPQQMSCLPMVLIKTWHKLNVTHKGNIKLTDGEPKYNSQYNWNYRISNNTFLRYNFVELKFYKFIECFFESMIKASCSKSLKNLKHKKQGSVW